MIDPMTFQSPSNSNNDNYCCYCFDGVWKVKPKYIVLCSNALP